MPYTISCFYNTFAKPLKAFQDRVCPPRHGGDNAASVRRNSSTAPYQPLGSAFLFYVCVLFGILVHPTFSKAEIPTDDRIHITSDEMVMDRTGMTVTFSGNVEVTRQPSVLTADTVTVWLFTEEEKKALKAQSSPQDGLEEIEDIKRMEARGHVRVVQEESIATSEKAVFDTLEGTIVLTGGPPRVSSAAGYITGKRIIIFQADNRVVVKSDATRRVEALFENPDTKQKADD